MSHQRESNQPGFNAAFDANGYKIDHRSETEQRYQLQETRRLPGGEEIHTQQNKTVNLEELKSRETSRIATAEDVRALLEAEFQGIREIQTSREISVEEFNLIESQFRKKIGAKSDSETTVKEEHRLENVLESPQWKGQFGMPVSSKNEIVDVREATVQESNYDSQGRVYQYGPGVTVTTSEHPEGYGSLRHETKQKRHVLEEVVIEGSDKFYENTAPKKSKTMSQQVERSGETEDLGRGTVTNDTARASGVQTTRYQMTAQVTDGVNDDLAASRHPHKHKLVNENPNIKLKKKRSPQNELVLEDTDLFTDESQQHGLFSHEYKIKPMYSPKSKAPTSSHEVDFSTTGTSKEKENVTPVGTGRRVEAAKHGGSQQELVLGDVTTFKDGTVAVVKNNNRSIEKLNQETSVVAKPGTLKTKLNVTEAKFVPKVRHRQEEIVLNDPTVYDEVQFFSLKKSKHENSSFENPRTLPAKFKSETSEPEAGKELTIEHNRSVQLGGRISGSSLVAKDRETSEEMVLDDPDVFREAKLTTRHEKSSQGSLDKQMKKLEAIEKEIQTKSLGRSIGMKHKGPQAEVVIDDPDIFRETTLKRQKKEKAAKASNKIMNDILLDISTMNQESQEARKKNDSELTSEVGSKIKVKKQTQPEMVIEERELHRETVSMQVQPERIVVEQGRTSRPEVVDQTTIRHTESQRENHISEPVEASVKPIKTGSQITNVETTVEAKDKTKEGKHAQTELVLDDQTIYADHNRPKDISVEHAKPIHIAEMDDFTIFEAEMAAAEAEKTPAAVEVVEIPSAVETEKNPSAVEAEKKPSSVETDTKPGAEKSDKKSSSKKRFFQKKKKIQSESVVDQSFVYEDATRVRFPKEEEEGGGKRSKSGHSTGKTFWSWKFGQQKPQAEVIKDESHYHEDLHLETQPKETVPNEVQKEESAAAETVETIPEKEIEDELKTTTGTVPENLELEITGADEMKIDTTTQFVVKPSDVPLQHREVAVDVTTTEDSATVEPTALKEEEPVKEVVQKGKHKFKPPFLNFHIHKPHFGHKKQPKESPASEEDVAVVVVVEETKVVPKVDKVDEKLDKESVTVVQHDTVNVTTKVHGPTVSKFELPQQEVVVSTDEQTISDTQVLTAEIKETTNPENEEDTEPQKDQTDHRGFKIHLPHIPKPHINLHLKKNREEGGGGRENAEQVATNNECNEAEITEEEKEKKLNIHLPHLSMHMPHIGSGASQKQEEVVINSVDIIPEASNPHGLVEVIKTEEDTVIVETKDAVLVETKDAEVPITSTAAATEAIPLEEIEANVTLDTAETAGEKCVKVEEPPKTKTKNKFKFNFPHFSLPKSHSKQEERVPGGETTVSDTAKIVKTEKAMKTETQEESEVSTEVEEDQAKEIKAEGHKFKIHIPKPHFNFGFKKSQADKKKLVEKTTEETVVSEEHKVEDVLPTDKADVVLDEPQDVQQKPTAEDQEILVEEEHIDLQLQDDHQQLSDAIAAETTIETQVVQPVEECSQSAKQIAELAKDAEFEPTTITVESEDYKMILIKKKHPEEKSSDAAKLIQAEILKENLIVAESSGPSNQSPDVEKTEAIPNEIFEPDIEHVAICEAAVYPSIEGEPVVVSVDNETRELQKKPAVESLEKTETAIVEEKTKLDEQLPCETETLQVACDEVAEKKEKVDKEKSPSASKSKEHKSKFHLPCIKLKKPLFKSGKHEDTGSQSSDEQYYVAETHDKVENKDANKVEVENNSVEIQKQVVSTTETKPDVVVELPKTEVDEVVEKKDQDDKKQPDKVSKKKNHAFTIRSLGRKPAQEEIVVNDAHIYTDNSTLGRKLRMKHKQKDKAPSRTFIVENNLPESSEAKDKEEKDKQTLAAEPAVEAEIVVGGQESLIEKKSTTVEECLPEQKTECQIEVEEQLDLVNKHNKQDELVIGASSIVTEPQTSLIHKKEQTDKHSTQDLSETGKTGKASKITSFFHRSSGEYDLDHQKRTNQPLVELISSRPTMQDESIITETASQPQSEAWSISYQKNLTMDASNRLTFEADYDPDESLSIENVQLFCPSARRSYKRQMQLDDQDLVRSRGQIDSSTPIKRPDGTIDSSTPDEVNETAITPVKDRTSAAQPHPVKWTGTPSKSTSYFTTIPSFATVGDQQKPLQFVVVAIDFGNTFSGYAFSFTHDLDSIHVMRKWEGGDPGVTNQKTPTTLLLTPSKEFHSFGFTARDFYHDLSPKEAKRWLYFEKFKMALHYNADLSSETEIPAANGTPVKALEVFSHALRFFRNHALQEISEQTSTDLVEDDVRWVITVPAIWKAPAKQFMREAAYNAGIASRTKADQLLIALEPEAASIFVRKQRLRQLIPEDADDLKDSRKSNQDLHGGSPSPVLLDSIAYQTHPDDTSSWSHSMASNVMSTSFQRCPSPTSMPVSVGHEIDITDNRFMVADCGGGTVDITIYEMLSATGGKLKELYKASGGPYGSIGVDLEFEKLLVSIFGQEFIEAFKLKRPAGWVDLMMAFESRKRAANPFKTKPLNVSLPFSFIDYHKKFKNSTVEYAVRKFNHKDVKWSSQGMLRLMPDAMNDLFQPTLDNVTQAIATVLGQPDVSGVKQIFLVGGFAESPMLQQEVRKHFANQMRILIPADVSLTILKGGVLFGIDPSIVVIRKSRLTYGLGVLNRFVQGKHPESKKAMKDDVPWCVDVFDPLVYVDQSVALGSSVIRSYTPAGTDQKFSFFHIYCSENRNVEYVTDKGVVKCGTLRLDLDDHQWELDSNPSRPVSQNFQDGESSPAVDGSKGRREVQARLTFGDTEIKIIALDVATGNYVRATLDFLNK